MPKIVVIGGGWYGAHIARKLALDGHSVTLVEKEKEIIRGVSGEFGIRLHKGPHYPRSPQTRKSCRSGYDDFLKEYPELIIENRYSIYGLGERDAEGYLPKVNASEFRDVCNESKNCRAINPKKWGYENLIEAFDVEEPSIVVGKKLRDVFEKYLADAGVKVVCNYQVDKITPRGDKVYINDEETPYDFVINATSYQAFAPSNDEMPFDMTVVYQPCLALVYEDSSSVIDAPEPPFSFIVMDGWFPCAMPFVDQSNESSHTKQKYILTHGKFTIGGSYPNADQANTILRRLKTVDGDFITDYVRPRAEADMKRFWPGFGNRFKYVGWKGRVIAKIKSDREFRSAVTFAKDRIINIIPGKVSNIFDAEREVRSIITNQNVLVKQGFSYVQGGELDRSLHEIMEKPKDKNRNTGELQPYLEWARSKQQKSTTNSLYVDNLLTKSYKRASENKQFHPFTNHENAQIRHVSKL